MPIPIKEIDEVQAQKVLATDEGHFLDFKQKEIKPAKLTESISAFANADGGEIFIGITDGRLWEGFTNVEAANGHVQCFEQFFPLGQYLDCEFLQCNRRSGLVLHLSIKKTPDIKNASSGMAYQRRGAQNLPVTTPESIRRLELNKGFTSFEVETVSSPLEIISASDSIEKFIAHVVPTSAPEPWLRKQQLIRNNLPTVAGVILFSDLPQAVLPKRCGIKIYRYKTAENEGTRETLAFDPISVEGNAYQQIKESVSKTIEFVEEVAKLGEGGFEKIKYPPETLHEIITNAILHRDYSIADDVHVRIFENRIEIESPGTLPAHITVGNILKERFSRNGNVVRLINKFPDPPNKDVGEGLNTAFAAMRKLKLKEPVILAKENSVLVTIRHEPLSTPENIVMEFLLGNLSINNSKGREICNIGSENVMKRVFERLIESGLIERIPERRGRATAYRKKTV
ncbi:MAG: putative DNA binding domain-containing protein [Elusimicrobia bacterium]|nr:putative DNA binding domain-containing protein [Elusimicrobiota bacterium]